MLHTQGFAAIDGQSLSRADGVLDLPAIEVVSGQEVVLLVGEICNGGFLKGAHPLDEDLEDGFLRLRVEDIVP